MLSLTISLILLAASAPAQPTCPSPAPTPCSPEAQTADPCCVPSPGGLFVFSQRFEPDHGDEGRWSIDSLEVLDCSAQPLPRSPTTYKAKASRSYNQEQISSYLASHPAFGTEYESWAEDDWADSEVGEGIEEQWERAWIASGRAVSTLEPACLPNYRDGQEVPIYFEALHKLHRSLPAAKFLADDDITPSEDTSYSRSELISALSRGGMEPYITCTNETIRTIAWPLAVVGKFQDGEFVSTSVGKEVLQGRGNCPEDGIIYPMAESAPPRTATHTWDPIYRPSPRALKLASDGSDDTATYHAGDRDHVDKKLKFFKKKDEGMIVEKEKQDEWGMKGRRDKDEL